MNGCGSSYEIANKYGISRTSVETWAKRYKEQGISAFERGTGNSHYSAEFKMKCVQLYISDQVAVDDIVAKYNISDRHVFVHGLSSIMPIENLRIMILKGRSIWQRQEEKQRLKNAK